MMCVVRGGWLSAFRMSDAPLDTAGALRALAAGGTLLILGVLLGDWARLGVAYLGAACSVAFVLGESYRVRFTVLAAASAGAAVGIVVGGSTTGHGVLPIIVVAVVAAAVSGLVGVVGPGGPAFGMMLSIGVAYGQFGGSGLSPLNQAVWYLVGALVVGVAHFAEWPFRAGVRRSPLDTTTDTQPHSIRGDAVRVLNRMRTPAAVHNSARTALCLGVATAITVAAHAPQHGFWLPLTVAVIVRPEYGSVVGRTVNRVAGTLIGAAVAAAVVAIWPSGIVVAVAASVGLAFAVLTGPKLYGLRVVGITLSALLSASVGAPDVLGPEIRLLDTLAGAVIAVVFGYLIWAGSKDQA
ncbi:MAG TPA: hypothetical protein DIW80_10625 [Gordonia polyisoprenivorans]|nr:hypothetical protein [Gordonia polyisoprenivorans]